MAIDLGSGNTTRYHSVPDHADFSLPNWDWAWVTLCYPQDSAATKYIVSTGGFGLANSFNLFLYNSASPVGWAARVDSLTETNIPGVPSVNTWYWVYATRRSSNYYVGAVPVGGTSASESTGVPISISYNSTTGPNIGRRSDGTADRHWKGRWGQVAFISGASITAAQAVELAGGAPLLSMPFAPTIKALWHGKNANDSTLVDIVGGHVATRQGTSYGTSEEDIQTPYIWVPEYIRGVTTTVTTHNLTASNSTQANTASGPAVTQTHVIAGANSTQSNAAVAGAITQDHTLSIASATQTNTASEGSVSTIALHNLAVSNANQANTGSTAVITQAHVLVHSPSIQDNIAAESAIVQQHVLAIANAAQANAASDAAITVIGINDLAAGPITQGNTASTGRVTRNQTLTIANAEQINGVSTGAVSDGIIFESALATVTPAAGAIKKPGIPNDTPAWLKTSMEIVMGRRGNRINVPEQQTLTFSATPTKAECEALYNYTNTVRDSLAQLINRLDS